MDVPVLVESEGGTNGRQFVVGLDPASLDQASEWCGSYHILQMGEHFDAYVISPRLAQLPPIPNFPHGRRYTVLPGKLQAPSVQGNIGEVVAALTAVCALGFKERDIAHIKPGLGRSGYKAPDLLCRATANFKTLVQNLVGLGDFEMPEWIPCEAKCRRRAADVVRAMQEARGQLEEFWDQLVEAEKGFGIACCFIHQPPQEVRVRLFVPARLRGDYDAFLDKI